MINRQYHTFIVFTFALALVVILLGAYTRLTNAGLSCPDWPHCYGFLTAPHTTDQLQEAAQRYPNTPVDIKKAWTEMVHRYLAGLEGLCILWLSGAILFNRQSKDRLMIAQSIALVGLLGVQVTLGMLTVTAQLKPLIVLSHLLTALTLLSVLWCLVLSTSSSTPAKASRYTPGCWFGLLVIVLQIVLGGLVSSHYAGLACIDLPYCNGVLLPTLHLDQLNTDLITIHMLHRIGAVITASVMFILGGCLLRHPGLRAQGAALLLLILLQLTLGVFNILWLRPVNIALAHHLVAILLLLTLIASVIKSYHVSEGKAHVR